MTNNTAEVWIDYSIENSDCSESSSESDDDSSEQSDDGDEVQDELLTSSDSEDSIIYGNNIFYQIIYYI
jgi:hypothetical protein